MIWITRGGKRLKIRDMESNHLVGVLIFIDKHILNFKARYGEKKTNKKIYNIKQEVRLRKLNRIKINKEEEEKEELF